MTDERTPMTPDPTGAAAHEELTVLLRRMQGGEAGAADALSEAVYSDLRAMARGHLARDLGAHAAGVTIQPTMLANDTLMKLLRQRQQYDNTGHFFALASKMMVRVLLDYHRIRNAQKRGRALVHVPLEAEHNDQLPDERAARAGDDVDVEAFTAALERLSALDPRKADIVRYRILWGFTVPEVSEAMDLSVSRVERDWAFAKAWLTKELQAKS